MHTHKRACACILTHLCRHWLGKCPPELVQGRLKYLFTGYLGLLLIFLKFGHRGEYGTVRYIQQRSRTHCILLQRNRPDKSFQITPVEMTNGVSHQLMIRA